MPELPPLKLLAPKESRRLGRFLLESGYTEEGKKDLWDRALPPVNATTKGWLLDLAGNVGPLATLVRLFELGLPVEPSDAMRDLPDWFRDACMASGLLQEQDNDIRAAFRIDSLRGKLLVCDYLGGSGTALDVVVGMSGVAARLLDGTPRTPVRSALDVCVGGGIQSLFLADHCESVVGIDLNPRALEVARFNMRLNGVDNVELLQGNRLDPVADKKFDLIVCNPPFYISPTRRTLYSDNEMELDEFCRCILREAAEHLNEGGQLHVLAEWAEIEGQTPRERLGEWFEGLGCDAWAMREYQNDVTGYIRKRLVENTPGNRNAVTGWLQFFEQHQVSRIHGGAVALRRRQGKTWFFLDEFDRRVTNGFGDHIVEGFSVRDFLHGHEANESLLTARFTISPNARIEEHLTHDGGEWTTDYVRLRMHGAGECSAKTTNSMVRVLKHLDGNRTLEQAIRTSRDLEDETPIPHLTTYLDTIRRLLIRGFLIPKET